MTEGLAECAAGVREGEGEAEGEAREEEEAGGERDEVRLLSGEAEVEGETVR